MYHISTTPFGRRPVTAGLIETQLDANADITQPVVDKYALLDDLRAARAHYNLSDRELSVLATLLSFKSGRTIADDDDLIVFPSNRTLSQRAHGMAESTLRRHLATLIASGLIQRNDSPNGKRYAARDAYGNVVRSFGFDLRPLLVHAQAIEQHAQIARDAALTLRRLREDIVLMNRDASKLITYAQSNKIGAEWSSLTDRTDSVRQMLRRKLDISVLQNLRAETHDILTAVTTNIEGLQTPRLSGTDSQNERHHQDSNIELLESDRTTLEPVTPKSYSTNETPKTFTNEEPPRLPLSLVIKACPDLEPYAIEGKIKHWHQLVATAHQLHRMMGISAQTWERAQHVMGPEIASITLGGILQRIADIRSPSAYLQALTNRAKTRGFSPGPMIMALLNISEDNGSNKLVMSNKPAPA